MMNDDEDEYRRMNHYVEVAACLMWLVTAILLLDYIVG